MRPAPVRRGSRRRLSSNRAVRSASSGLCQPEVVETIVYPEYPQPPARQERTLGDAQRWHADGVGQAACGGDRLPADDGKSRSQSWLAAVTSLAGSRVSRRSAAENIVRKVLMRAGANPARVRRPPAAAASLP